MLPVTSKLSTFFLLAILGLAFVGLMVIPQVHATTYTNGIAYSESVIMCTSVTTCTTTSLSTNVGDLLVARAMCLPVTVGTMALTDVSGDNFNTAIAVTSSSIAGSGVTYKTQTFYASSAKSTSTGTITLTLGATATSCSFIITDINTQAVGLLNQYSSTFSQNDIAFGSSYVSPMTVTTGVPSSIGPAPAGTYFIMMTFGTTSSPYYNYFISDVPTAPMIKESNCNYPVGSGNACYQAINVNYFQFTADTFQVSAFSGSFVENIGAGYSYLGTLNIGAITLAFSTSGSTSACTSANAIQGSTNSQVKLMSGSTALVGGDLYVNWFNTGSGYVTMTQMQANVKSITVSGTQQLTLGLYVSSSMPPTSASLAILAPGVSHTWPITTNASPQNFTWSFSYQTPPNYYVFITLGVSSNGVTIYNSTTTSSPTSIDSSNVFVSGVPPAALSDLTLNQKNINLFGNYLIPCTQVIIQVVKTTMTSVSTTGTGGPGGVGFDLGNMVLDVIVVLGPALVITEVTKSMFGAILGATLGIVVGVMVGIMPFWAVIVIVLACVAMLFLGRRNEVG